MQKWRVIGGVGAVGLAALAVLLLSPTAQNAASAQQVETVNIELTDLSTSIESAGTVAPAQSVMLSFGTSGIVRAVEVEVGDAVQAGDVLATLDTGSLEVQIRLQEQALIVQQTNYDDLIAPPTAEQIAQAEANLASAQAQLLQAQNSLTTAPNNTTINCADVDERETALLDAQEAWDDYVSEGYELDATFLPDTNSEVGEVLTSAQRAYDVAAAQCGSTTPSDEYETQVNSAQASVNQAQAALDALMAGATEAEIAAAEAQLEQARLELENAQASLEDAQIVAPFDGVIAAVDIEVGAMTNANASAIRIVDTSSLHVDVAVDEVDIPQVQVGQTARITPDALSDVTLEGTVSRIAPTGTDDNGIVTFDVRIDLANLAEQRIYPGMTTDVEIVTGSEQGVLVVPTDAIQRSGTSEFVEVLNADNTTRQINITTGLTIDGMTVISGEIEEGMAVVMRTSQANTAGGGLPGPFGG